MVRFLLCEKFMLTNAMYVHCSFDQALLDDHNIDNQREDWKVFLAEMDAQFFFHCGTALLNKALKVGVAVIFDVTKIEKGHPVMPQHTLVVLVCFNELVQVILHK
jgi:hypothetical protein